MTAHEALTRTHISLFKMFSSCSGDTKRNAVSPQDCAIWLIISTVALDARLGVELGTAGRDPN